MLYTYENGLPGCLPNTIETNHTFESAKDRILGEIDTTFQFYNEDDSEYEELNESEIECTMMIEGDSFEFYHGTERFTIYPSHYNEVN